MLGLSPKLEEKLWGDEAILSYLEAGREAFESGDRSALLDVVFLCARFQAVFPDWATDALLDIEQKLESGDLKDLNEAFGWKPEDRRRRRKIHRQNQREKDILTLLLKHRLEGGLEGEGGSLNAEVAFDPIAEELDISRRDVEAVYKRNRQFIKTELPRGNPGDTIHGFARLVLPVPRRRGRPILRDPEG
jgi:hypothetical protein